MLVETFFKDWTIIINSLDIDLEIILQKMSMTTVREIIIVEYLKIKRNKFISNGKIII